MEEMEKDIDYVVTENQNPSGTILKISGKSFNCQCGANVFTEITYHNGENGFRCNSCKLLYLTEY